MRFYLEVARLAFRQALTYRTAALAGLFTNSVFGIFLATIFIAFYESADGVTTVAGFNVSQATTYTWLNQSMIAVIFIWGWWVIALDIRTGAIVSDFVKPMNFFGYWLARDLGRAAAQLLTRFAPTITVGALVFTLEGPHTPLRLLAYGPSIVLAVVLCFTWKFMLNVLVFWTLDHRGISYISMAVINVLSGFLLPLSFFPDAIRPALEVLPWRGMMQIPAELYLGQISWQFGLAFQIGWSVVLIAGALGLWQLATRKVVIQGG